MTFKGIGGPMNLIAANALFRKAANFDPGLSEKAVHTFDQEVFSRPYMIDNSKGQSSTLFKVLNKFLVEVNNSPLYAN